MSAHPRRRLTALLVNHDSGAWAVRCVESLAIEWERDDRDPADLRVVVADSGSREGERTWFRSLEHLGARVVPCAENVGYAAGLGRAWRCSRGERGDFVALLNPDLYFLPGSIGPLLGHLDRSPGTGAAAPRCFVDEARQIHLPPSRLPGPGGELGELLAARSPRLARRLAAVRSRRNLRWWTNEEPLRAPMLSGACLFLRSELVQSLGGPMDEGYPLYFEDADLCARLGSMGYSLDLVPHSEVLHHWSRCAGPVFGGEVARRWTVSRERWMARHHGDARGAMLRAAGTLARRLLSGRPPRAMHALTDLGASVESPTIDLPEEGSWQLELSLTPWWGLAAGILVEGGPYRMPARTWSWLFPGTYYLRALDRESGALLGAWRFEKTSAARSWPVDPGSLPRPLGPARHPAAGERVG